MLTKPVIAASAGLLIALPMGPALAKDAGTEVRTSGQCSGSATWKLKVKDDDGGVEVEFEVDSNVVGQAWDYTVSGPGGQIASGTRTTTAPSGSFSVEVRTSGAVTDTFTGVATFNGQRCDSTVSSPNPNPSPTDDNPSGDDDGTDDKGGRNDDNRGRGERVEGTCSDDSVAAVLRVKPKWAVLRVDSDSRGELWRYEIRRGDDVVKRGTARTKGGKSMFKVKAKSRTAGSFTATAERVGDDDSCQIAS